MSLPNTPPDPAHDDALVRGVLRAAAQAPAAAGCPDAEQLALYAEQDLGGPELAMVHQHVRGCPRCQALVAAFVRARPEGEAASAAGAIAAAGVATVTWWKSWRWLVPLAATAGVAVLAVWIGQAPGERAAEVARGPAQEADAVTAPPAAPAAAAAGTAADAKEVSAPAATPSAAGAAPPAALARANGGQAVGAVAKAKEPSAPGVASPAAQNAIAARADAAPEEARQLRDAAADKLTAAGRLAEAVTAQPAPPPPAPAAVAPPAPASPVPAAAPAEAPAPAATADTRFRSGAGARAEAEPARKAAAPATAEGKSEVAGAASRDEGRVGAPWRLRAGVVERSADGGRTWVRVTLPTKEAVRAISGTDATTATVTTATGTRFRTSDGGATWRRVGAPPPDDIDPVPGH